MQRISRTLHTVCLDALQTRNHGGLHEQTQFDIVHFKLGAGNKKWGEKMDGEKLQETRMNDKAQHVVQFAVRQSQ